MPRLALHAGIITLLVSCSQSAFTSKDYEDGAADSGWAGGYDEADADTDTDTDSDADDGYEPEDENDFLKLEPAATNVYVFVANATRDTVTRVSVPSLEVLTTEVGVTPSVVATTEDYSRAVTFNAGSDSISVIDAETLDVSEVEVRDNLNAMMMSPDGRWVLCYHDMDGEDQDDGGAVSFNEVSLVDVESLVHYPMVVGFNPREVQFTDDSALAIVVSDAYLAVIDLTVSEPSPERILIADDTVDPPEAEEVVLAPDGSYAFVRQFAVEHLVVVDLVSHDVEKVDVGSNPTDLDLSPDGSMAIAVARGANQLWLYAIDDPFGEPTVIDMPDDEVFGSLLMSPDDRYGLLYSTASGVSHLGAWDRWTDEIAVHSLVKPVSTMGITPNGGTALVFHDESNGDVESDSAFYNEFGLTLLDLSDFFANPLLLPDEPLAYANAEDGETGYFIMAGEELLEVLHYETLLYDEIPLKSQPVHVGVLPESNTAYVNQVHDLGRLSFYDPDTEVLQTITGFELNAGIEHH